MKIIPAVLEKDYLEIERKIDSVSVDTDIVHIDICDGLMTSQKTWPYSQYSNNRIEENSVLKDLLNEDIGLPHWENIDYEFDLMIKNPDLHTDIWGRLGASKVIIHLSSFKDREHINSFISDIQSYMIDVILAFTYDEYVEQQSLIDELIQSSNIKLLQVMTIKNIGFQGQSFDDRCIELIQDLRHKYNNLTLRVDGGINDDTIDNVFENVDEIVIGSAIFSKGNPRENLNYFKDLC